MDGNDLRFRQGDTLLFSMMTGKVILGDFMRGPQIDYDYWTIAIPNDDTVIAIKGSNVESITRLSETALAEFMARSMQIEDEHDKLQGEKNGSELG